jgi:hypothetical protein
MVVKRLQRFSASDSYVLHYRSSEPDPWSRGRLDPGEAGGGGRGAIQAQQPEEGPFEQVRTFSGAGFRIRINFLRIRIQRIRMEANTDPDTDPDPIRIRIRIQITDPDPDPMVRLNTDPIRIRIRNPAQEILSLPNSHQCRLVLWFITFKADRISY